MLRNNRLAQARALQSTGRIAEAETLYRQMIESDPDASLALEGLGVLIFQQGRAGEAATLFGRAVARRPQSARLRANLGEALRVDGQFDAALDQLKHAVRLDPALAQAFNSLGLVAFGQRRFDEAMEAYREALRLRPKFAAVYINIANVHQVRRRRQDAAAALRAALSIEPDNPIALTNLGQILSEMDDPDVIEEAEALCRRAVAIAPLIPQAFESLGNVLFARDRYDEALSSYQSAARIDARRAMPRHFIGQILERRGDYDRARQLYEEARALEPREAQFHIDLGSLALALGQYSEAVEHFQRAVACNPRIAESHYELGRAYLEQGRLDLAEPCFHEALGINPDLSVSWIALARLQAERGEVDLSCASARAALALNPRLTEAYVRLAVNLRGDLPEAEIQAIERLIDQPALSKGRRASLHYALAQVHDARRLCARAAAHLESANALQRAAKAARGLTHDSDRYSRFIDQIIATFTTDSIDRTRAWGDPDPRPVFVVGLPRSGTSLVEQVLASHPQVYGAGELQDLHRLFLSLPKITGHPSADPFAAWSALGPDSARTVARSYLECLERQAPFGSVRIVDKMPDNIWLVGMIAALWPRAGVIVCDRDLRDVALSCWRTDFKNYAWTTDWSDIARRLADHKRLVHHWQSIRPTDWLIIRYEDLVRDFEINARRLVDFLGLEWDAACLEFYLTQRVVRTASQAQVRQPIYSHSIGQWRRYEPSMEPLFQAFKQLGIEDANERKG
jgi:tetratricopeptide (TPR) repeat protein